MAAFGRLVQAADWSPTERTDQPWKVVSLLEDGGLSHLNVFNLDFERDTNSPRLGTAWIATSDGLHEYDGYTWRKHGRAQGLPSDFVRCVLVTRAGAVWVGTDQGAGVYDGKTFRTLGSETNLAGPNVRRITEDPDGSIWFCSDSWPNAAADGGLTSLRDGQWKAYREADGLPSGYVVNYFRDRSGRQFAATLKGLAEFTAGRWAQVFPPPSGGRINWGSGSLAETPGSGLLYSTGREVFRWQDGAWHQLPAGTPHEHGIAATADGAVVAVGRPSKGQSVFLEWAGDRWVAASSQFSTPRGYTEDIREAPDGSVWVAGYKCLVRWARKGSQWHEFTDLPPPKVADAQGGVWFAQTRGFFTPGGPAVRFHQGRWEPLGTAYDELVNQRRDDSVWGWNSNRLTRWQGTNRTDFTPAQTGLESYMAGDGDDLGSFWLLGHDARGNVSVARHAGNQWQPAQVPELAGLNLWRTAAGSSNGVWFAGDHGVATAAVLVRVSPAGNLRLDAPAQRVGTQRMKFLEDRYGAVWLYGDAGLFRWVLGKSTQWESLGDLPSSSVVSCVERGNELWFGYNGATGGHSAIIGLRNGAWTNFPVATLGNLSLGGDGTLFADGVGQIFRIPNQPEAVPVVQQLRTAEPVQSVVQDLGRDLWVGVGDSVFQFRSFARPLRLVLTGPGRVHANEPLSVTATAVDRFRAQGTKLGAVFLSRVDGGTWSPMTGEERIKIDVSRLKVGSHRLEVVCQDAAGNRRSEPVVHRFQVLTVPLQERAWFGLGMLGLAAVMMTLALVALNARRQLAEYARTLEYRVAERTADLELDIRRRQKVEASLRASEDRFVQVFQCSPVLATITSLADKRLLDANQLFCEVFGFTRDELIGQLGPQLEFWHDPVQRDRLMGLIRENRSVRNAEVQTRTRSGQILDLLVFAERVELAGGPAVLIFGVNVTESRRAEAARRASEARYRTLFEYAPDGILIGDAQSTYLDANPSMCRMLGYTHGELVGLNATDIIAQAEVPFIGPTIAVIHRGSDYHHEWTFRRKDGSLFPVEVRATRTPDGNLLGLVRDLTEHKRAEAALRAKDELLRLVIDLVPHFIFAKDQHSRFLFVNRVAAEAMGLSPEELVGRNDLELPRSRSEAEAFMRDDHDVLTSGQPKFIPAEQLTDEQDRVHIHQTTKIPFRVPGTDEPALLGVAIDITEQKRMERLLEWEMRALERLLSQASLEEFLRELALGVEQHAPGALCSILLLDHDGRHLRHGAAPSLSDAYNQAIDGIAVGPQVGSCGTAAATRRPVIVTDIGTDPLWANFRELALAHGLRACWSVPIAGSAGEIHGTFAVYYREPRSPKPAELEMISRAQHLVGLAIERKRAEESLQMTRLSVDRASDSVFWIGRDGRIHYANEAACVSRGYSREELLGMTIFDLDPDYQPGVWEPHFEDLKRHGALTLETRHRTKDGRLFPIEVNANYVFIRGQEFNFCFVRDITTRRRAERRRAVEHTVSRILAESASLAAATPQILEAIGTSEGWKFGELWNVDGGDGRLVCQETWSAAGLKGDALEAQTRQLRLASGEGLPGGVYQTGGVMVIPDVGCDTRFIRAQAAVAAGLAGAIAFPLRADGPITGVMGFLGAGPMDADPELGEMLRTLGNQIGQFMARQRVQEELRRYVALSPSVIYALRVTPAGLRAYWVSENVFNLTGYHPSESIHGTWWVDHLHPEDRDRVLRESAGVGEAEHQVLEFRFRRKDGTYFSLRDEKRLRRDATGKLVEIIGAWTDITDRVSLEKQLRQSQKMEAIGLLSGGIAHDFNNLLGTVIGNAQLAALDVEPDHPVAESLEQILTASGRAAHLVQQILTFARQERTKRDRISPLVVVEESVRLLRATLPAMVHLTLIKGEGLPAVFADETQIQQVLINLGTNSWHAFEGGSGRISIELSAVEVDAELAASSPDLKPGPYLRIRVEDTGKGMDAATLEHIFEPFFTTKEVGKGTGLGLSVVHGIIKAHDGAITVQSAVGVGTTFDLFLPAAPGDDTAGRLATGAPLKSGHGEQLLLIDDQGEMLRTNRRALERLGYFVVTCKDAAEAQTRFRAEPDAFALVLTDLNMPGMSGVELARILLALRPGLPVLLTSGFITEELRQLALAAGVRDVLRKPVALLELSEAIFKNLQPQP